MKLTVYDHRIGVSGATSAETSWLKTLVRYERPGRRITGSKYQPYVSLYRNRCFPTGYLNLLQTALAENEISPEVVDRRSRIDPPSPVRPDTLRGVSLREYQLAACRELLEYYPRRGVVHLPPGSGKTEILLTLLQAACQKACLWLCPSVNVLAQTEKRLQERVFESLRSRSSLGRRIDFVIPQGRKFSDAELAEYDTLIVDECHHMQAQTWFDVAMRCPAPFRFGTSATPEGSEEGSVKLHAAIGPIRYALDYETCYMNGWLSRPTVRMVSYLSSEVAGVKTRVGNRQVTKWADLYDAGIVDNAARNEAAFAEACYYCIERQIPVIVLCRLKDKHCHALCIDWHGRGVVPVECIDGDDSPEVRDAQIAWLRESRGVLLATRILAEGQDIPWLSAVVNLSGGDNLIQTIQAAGRVMRPQTPAFLSDFVDSGHPILLRHSRTRRELYQRIGSTIEDVVR